MSESQAGSSKPFDPAGPFREMRDAYLDAMSKAMVDAVNTEGYAQASGAMLDSALTISAPFREAMETSMLQVLQQLSLPSRQDIVGLAERFTNMEMRLDDMDAKLDRIVEISLGQAESASKARQATPAAVQDVKTGPAPQVLDSATAAPKSAVEVKAAPQVSDSATAAPKSAGDVKPASAKQAARKGTR